MDPSIRHSAGHAEGGWPPRCSAGPLNRDTASPSPLRPSGRPALGLDVHYDGRFPLGPLSPELSPAA